MSKITGTSTYYITTDDKIQVALKFTLLMTGNPTNIHKVRVELYNGDPSSTAPVYVKTQQLGDDDILNLGNSTTSGGLFASGGFTPGKHGVTFVGSLGNSNSSAQVHGLIGVFNGNGSQMSRPFKFAKDDDGYPSLVCKAELGLEWNTARGDYNLNWSFEGQSGIVELVNGAGSINYMENGLVISGTFHEDLSYKFSGSFIKPNDIQLGFIDATYAGWMEKSIR